MAFALTLRPLRCSRFLAERLAEWVKAGRLRRNGNLAKPREKVVVGDRLVLQPEYDDRVDWGPEHLPVDILYEDDHLIVLNKPVGLVVHPAAGHHSGTLVNRLLAHAPDMAALPRGGIVHRLDKDTSGIMLAARSPLAHRSLVAQLADRSLSRRYSAVCRGTFTGGGTIEGPIGRHPTSRTKMAVVPDGRPAVTHYRIAQRFGAHPPRCQFGIRSHAPDSRSFRVAKAPIGRGSCLWRPCESPRRCATGYSMSCRDSIGRRLTLVSRRLLIQNDGKAHLSADVPADLAALLTCLEAEDPTPQPLHGWRRTLVSRVCTSE